MDLGRLVVRTIRDPIHSYISLYDEDARIIDSPLFQRLRRIRQTGTMGLTYPSAVGTRFEHSIGAMHLAGRFLEAAIANTRSSSDKEHRDCLDAFLRKAAEDLKAPSPEDAAFIIYRAVRIAALLHDIGHFPFSHCLEPVFHERLDRLLRPVVKDFKEFVAKRPKAEVQLHEYRGHALLQSSGLLPAELGTLSRLVGKILSPTEDEDSSIVHTLHDIVSGDVDADRCDYLLRDAYTTGSGIGTYDLERLLLSMRFCMGGDKDIRIRPSLKGLSAVETMLLERHRAYKWVVFHHRVVASEAMLRHVFEVWGEAKASGRLKPDTNSALLELRVPSDFDLSAASPDLGNAENPLYFDDTHLTANLLALYRILSSRSHVETVLTDAEVKSLRAALAEILLRRKHCLTLCKRLPDFERLDANVAAQVPELKKMAAGKLRLSEGLSTLNYFWSAYLRNPPTRRRFCNIYATRLEHSFGGTPLLSETKGRGGGAYVATSGTMIEPAARYSGLLRALESAAASEPVFQVHILYDNEVGVDDSQKRREHAMTAFAEATKEIWPALTSMPASLAPPPSPAPLSTSA